MAAHRRLTARHRSSTTAGFVIVPLVGLVLGAIDLGRRPRKAAIAGVIINSLVLAGGVLFVLLVFASGSTTPTPSPAPPS